MNQDSFRRLLETSRPSTISPVVLGTSYSTSRSRQSRQIKTAEVVSKPAFKPRNIIKPETRKAHEPKIPEEKNPNVNNNIDVELPPSKGLDFALLEQERAKAQLLSSNDVDDLDQAFAESSALHNSKQVAPTKRTREDLIRELKQRRSDAGASFESIKADTQLEDVKQKGKFKPIGSTSTTKRKDGANTTDRKKKKRKVDKDKKALAASGMDTSPTKTIPEHQKPTLDENLDDNFDIFAGAGEYTGVEIDENEEAKVASPHVTEESSLLPQRWIATDEPEHVPQARFQVSAQLPPEDAKVAADEEVEERPMRLAPLETSAVPSIRELLEMHDATDKYEKKMKRKEKQQRKRGGKGREDEDD